MMDLQKTTRMGRPYRRRREDDDDGDGDDFTRDVLDAYPCESELESDCFESDSDADAHYSAYAGAHVVYERLARRQPQVYLRRNLRYHVRRVSIETRDEASVKRGRECQALEAENKKSAKVTYEYERCSRAVSKTKAGFSCYMCPCVCLTLRALMTHLRASHDLFRYDAKRETASGDARVTVHPKRENFDERRMFRLKSVSDTKTSIDRQFVFYRGRGGLRHGRGFFRGVASQGLEDADGKTTPQWEDLKYADMYDEAKAHKKQKLEEAERERVAALPHRPKVAIKQVALAKLPPKRPALKSDKPLGPFYHSRTFIEMDRVPTVDSDDEDPTEDLIIEHEQFINEFTDFSRDEMDFMVDWNAHALRFRPLAEYDVPRLCESFARWKRKELRKNSTYFKFYMMTLTNMFDYGTLDRRAVVRLLRALGGQRTTAPPTTTTATTASKPQHAPTGSGEAAA